MAVAMAMTAALIVLFVATRGGAETEPSPGTVVSPSATGAAPGELAPGPPGRIRREAAERRPLSAQTPRRGPLWEPGVPGYRLIRVRKDTRVQLYDRPRGDPEAVAGRRTEFGSLTVLSVVHRRGEWLELTTPLAPDNGTLWARANRSTMRFETTSLSIHASLSGRVVELRRGKRVLRSFPVTVGAPGSTTPTGRYAITDVFVGELNPVYGCCAIALSAHQPDLPPGWIGGDRVAIHGTSGPVGEAASSGCIRAGNEAISSVARVVPLGTPVFIDA